MLCCWSQLESLISHSGAYSMDATCTVNGRVALVEQALTELHNLVNGSDYYDTHDADRLQFILEQISLLSMKQKHYSCVTIAFRFFAVSLSVCLFVCVCTIWLIRRGCQGPGHRLGAEHGKRNTMHTR
jgi:hypothetical protein